MVKVLPGNSWLSPHFSFFFFSINVHSVKFSLQFGCRVAPSAFLSLLVWPVMPFLAHGMHGRVQFDTSGPWGAWICAVVLL